ncbi:MAG TPA: HAD family hydrolase [Planctomycetaceae bacterium]
MNGSVPPSTTKKSGAVLFDLDDTLNDRNASWAIFVSKLRREFEDRLSGSDDTATLEAILHLDEGGYRPKEEFFADLLLRLPWSEPPSSRQLEAFWRETFPSCMVERDGAKSLLADLRAAGIGLAIVTNGRTDMQTAKIHYLGLHTLVDAVVISESAGVQKPDPRIYQRAIGALSSTNESAWFVGDSPELDIIGPAKLGLRTAWLKNGRTWPVAMQPPDCQLSSLEELRPPLLGTRQS